MVTYPMETLRTHMALGGQSYRECLSDVIRCHGHRGLYKGFTSGVVSLINATLSAAVLLLCLTWRPALTSGFPEQSLCSTLYMAAQLDMPCAFTQALSHR